MASERATLAAADWQQSILNMCLYADRVWLPDVAEVVALFGGRPELNVRRRGSRAGELLITLASLLRLGPRVSRQDHLRYNYYLNEWGGLNSKPGHMELTLHEPVVRPIKAEHLPFLRMLDALQPLVEMGVIQFYSPFRIYWDYVAESLFGEQRWMTKEEVRHGWPSLFVAEGLRFADVLNVPYTATTAAELTELQNIATAVQQHLQIDQRILAGITQLKLPGFSADPSILASARANHEGFADFRVMLREVFSNVQEDIGSSSFNADVKRIERDILQPELASLVSSARSTRSLKNHMKDGAIDFSVAAFAVLASVGEVDAAVSTGGLTAGARFLLNRIVKRENVSPAARFVQRMTVTSSS